MTAATLVGVGVNEAVGRYGEQVAARYLQSVGIRILDRNWRCPAGEIDIVAEEDGVLVICEVKTRRGLDFGAPADAVTARKASRLRGLGLRWLAEQGGGYRPLRFDVVSVVAQPRTAPAIEHLRGAF